MLLAWEKMNSIWTAKSATNTSGLSILGHDQHTDDKHFSAVTILEIDFKNPSRMKHKTESTSCITKCMVVVKVEIKDKWH